MAQSVTPRLARSLVAPTLAVLALVLVLISGTFAVLLVSVRDFDRESRSAGRAERILGISAAAERHVVDVETGLRGYLLTGDPRVPRAVPLRPAQLRRRPGARWTC